MSRDTQREQKFAEAEAALEEFFARVEGGGEMSFEEWCIERAHIAGELRELHEACRVLSDVLDCPQVRTLVDSPTRAAQDARRALTSGADSPSELLARLLRRGSDFSDYQVGDRIARGGMGEILLVHDEVLHRDLAMKVIRRPDGVRTGADREVEPTKLTRFLEEARIMGRLDHPGIVPVHELGLDPEGRPYFTMKLVKGRTLKEIFEAVRRDEEREWTQPRVLSLIVRVCEAMAYAHAQGVIHRDLKPANVMVGKFGEVYVMDWGLARSTNKQAAHDLSTRQPDESDDLRTEHGARRSEAPSSPLCTKDGDTLGTPAYMSPEQALGRRDEVGPHSDVYAVGAMLYELLSGRPPRGEDPIAGDHRVKLQRELAGPPDPLHALAPHAPAELVSICERAMAHEWRARYRDMSELSADLASFIEGRVVRAYESGTLAELKKWVKRNKVLTTSVALAVASAIVGTSRIAVVEARSRSALQVSSDYALPDALTAEDDRLWPAIPSKVAEIRAWVESANGLIEREVQRGARAAVPADTVELVRLERLLAFLADLKQPATGRLARMMWRLELASTIERRSISDDDPARRWREAIESIGDTTECPHYGGLLVRPLLGLVPIGRDPASGLWEFAHLPTGDPAEREPDGKLVLTETTGLVLVLIPSGNFWMGAQRADPIGPNYDPDALENESPPNAVTLDAYFLSKYEMTQGQWQRSTGANPSFHHPGNYDTRLNADRQPWSALHPVEQVSWVDCTTLLDQLGLALPTEAQWEHACRAGRSSVYWSGDAAESLNGAANVADTYYVTHGGDPNAAHNAWDDGNMAHAEVGSYRPNAFGLHDVHGNVWEWCRDGHGGYWLPTRKGDGERMIDGSPLRVCRGGSCYFPASIARSAFRDVDTPENRFSGLGLRPAKAIVP